MTPRLIAVLALFQRLTIVFAQLECDCHSGDVPIQSSFQLLETPPDTCNVDCVWKISAADDDQRVQLTIQQIDNSLALTILDGASETSSPPLVNCDTNVRGSVCYSSGRYLTIRSDTLKGGFQQGDNIVLRLASVAQSHNSNGSSSHGDHTWLIIGLVVGLLLLIILLTIVIFLLYVHFKKRQESRYVASAYANSDMIFVIPSTPSIGVPSTPLHSSLMDVNETPKYAGFLQPAHPKPEEYFMRR